jgi:hypothetical protein
MGSAAVVHGLIESLPATRIEYLVVFAGVDLNGHVKH